MKSIKLLTLAMALILAAGCGPKDSKPEAKDDATKPAAAKAGDTGPKVKLEFHIMSKCPFGAKVLQGVVPVLEQIGSRVDFQVNYIGGNKGDLSSMHGEDEVKGNILQLCAREVSDFDKWVAFLKCQNGKAREWTKIPKGWEKCTETAGIDMPKMKECYEGEKGKELLRASFKISTDKKATGSPTIYLDGEAYRGKRTESAFAKALCMKMAEPKAAYCAQIPEPIKVPITVVADKRCKDRTCNTRGFLRSIANAFEGADIKEMDYEDEAAKALFTKSGKKYLPIVVFGPAVKQEKDSYERLKRHLQPMEGSEELVYQLGRTWDPTAEVCDDGVDNTNNGKVDCDDESCNSKKVCRKEIKNKLDVFVMSQCPYGVMAVDAMKEVLEAFDKDRSKIDFELNYIGQERDGKLTSMHGQPEVDENLRQLCAQKHYPKNYKFMDYVLCRNKDYRNNAWESCAVDGIKADVIKKCAEGDEGKALLSASYKKAASLQIGGSPNWLLNNRHDMKSRNPQGIKTEFCAKNDGTTGCEKTLSSGAGKKAPAGGQEKVPVMGKPTISTIHLLLTVS